MRAVSLALILCTASALAEHGPAESAAEFVKKLGTGKVDLAPDTDTAIVAEISPKKMESILDRLQRLAAELNGEDVEIGPTRIEGTLAGVIVRIVDPADPLAVHILPLAMVRNGETWRAAPVLASFENTVAGYSRSSRATAKELELWLAHEQVNEVERLRKSAGKILRQSLANAISPESIRTWTSEMAISEFLDACEKREIPRILALLGGFSDPLPDDWQEIAATVRTSAISSSVGSDRWSLLTSPAVLRMADSEQDSDRRASSCRVLFFDPRNEEDDSMRELTLALSTYDDGLWKITIPESETAVVDDDEIRERASILLTLKYPLRPLPSAEELKKSLLASFQSPNSRYSCLELVHRENHPSENLIRFEQAVQARWEAMNPTKPAIPLELGFFQQDDDRAYLAMQWLSLGKLIYSPRVFHFQKNPEGWVWNSSPDHTTSTAAEKWVKSMEAMWKKSFLELAVQSCALPDFSLPSPEDSQALKLVEAWLQALAANNWHDAISLCAQLGTDKSATLLLRNLGYECKAMQTGSESPPTKNIQRGKTVTLVATYAVDETRSIQSLLPVVSTPAGPRILMEIDLGDTSRPGRAFLNRNALARLASEHPETAKELASMISKHLGEETK